MTGYNNTDRRVYIAGCPDYDKDNVYEAVKRVFDGFGGIASFGLSGKKVLVKANLLSPHKPEDAVTTHPSVIRAITLLVQQAGGIVTIGDSPSGRFTADLLSRLYDISGMSRVAAETGAVLNLGTSSTKIANSGKTGGSFDIINAALYADFIITASKLKTHGLAYYTGAVKNLFGVIPGLGKAGMHSAHFDKNEFCEMIVDLCELIKPGFSITDGVVGMEGAGPSGGTPKAVGIIAGALNPHALDLAMCDIVSLPDSLVPTLTAAKKRKFIPARPELLEYPGDAPSRFKTVFKPAYGDAGKRKILGFIGDLVSVKLRKRPIAQSGARWPDMTSRCTGCAKCAEICPRQVIKIEDGKARVDYERCIKCYCCHEVCPAKAIELVKQRPY